VIKIAKELFDAIRSKFFVAFEKYQVSMTLYRRIIKKTKLMQNFCTTRYTEISRVVIHLLLFLSIH
jgi:hypothetical protein